MRKWRLYVSQHPGVVGAFLLPPRRFSPRNLSFIKLVKRQLFNRSLPSLKTFSLVKSFLFLFISSGSISLAVKFSMMVIAVFFLKILYSSLYLLCIINLFCNVCNQINLLAIFCVLLWWDVLKV